MDYEKSLLFDLRNDSLESSMKEISFIGYYVTYHSRIKEKHR